LLPKKAGHTERLSLLSVLIVYKRFLTAVLAE